MEDLKKIIEELKKEYPIDELVKFSEIDIHEKLQNNQFLVIKYKELYYIELNKLEELERKYEALAGIRYKYYRFEDEKEYQKAEIENYCLPSDKKIIEMKKIIARQKIKVRFFEMCWRSLEKQQWNMKVWNDREKQGL